MSSLHPLDPEITAETDAWFYETHPHGKELRTPTGGVPLDPNNPDDDQAVDDWVAEYRRRLREKEARVGGGGSDQDDDSEDDQGGTDPLNPCSGCCPTEFVIDQAPRLVIEVGEAEFLSASDLAPYESAGAATFYWTTESAKIQLEDSLLPDTQNAAGPSIRISAFDSPNQLPELGELVECTRTQPGCAPITQQVYVYVKQCKIFELVSPKIIAIASHVPEPLTAFADPDLPGSPFLPLAEDATHATGRSLPNNAPSQGDSVDELEPKMRKLLNWFAHDDADGKAERLFDHFLNPQTAPAFWSDDDLTSSLDTHPKINGFISRAMNSPVNPDTSEYHRIHQALEAASWDINAMTAPTDLGTPAVNLGNMFTIFSWPPGKSTGDFANGLGVMINDFTHVVAVATSYHYNRCNNEYTLDIDFVFYDVFGLDDEDIEDDGADGGFDSEASEGLNAWWQLQHQHNYAPPITRAVIQRSFTVPTR